MAVLTGNKARLSQLNDIEDSEQTLNELRSLVEGLKANSKKHEEMIDWIKGIKGIEEDKRDVLIELAEEHRQDFQEAQKVEIYSNLPVLKDMNWRLEIEISSREKKQSYVPNFLTSFTFEKYNQNANGQVEKQTETLCMNANAGMIKKLGEEMKSALNFPRSITYRKLHRGLK